MYAIHTGENLLGSVRMQLKISSSFLQQSQNKVVFLMSKEMELNRATFTWEKHLMWSWKILQETTKVFFPVTQLLSIAASIILKLLFVALEFGVSSVTTP